MIANLQLSDSINPADAVIFEVETFVKSNKPANGEYRHMILDAPSHVLNCQPGQFFHLLCPTSERHQPFLRRPMSIYGFFPEKNELHFLYKIAGKGTAALSELGTGDHLNVVGPLGHGYSIRDDWRNLLLVARGVGLATMAPLAQEAQRLGRKLTAICSARSENVLMSVDHFRALGADVITVTDEQGTSSVENMRRIIEEHVAAGKVDTMYTCGSNRLLRLLQEIGAAHGIPGEIALEQQMACGIGMCHCCVRPFRRDGAIVHERVCREGPVFDMQEAMGW